MPHRARSSSAPVSRRSAGGGAAGAAVAAGVHAGGQRQRALERVLEHGDEEAPQPADPAVGSRRAGAWAARTRRALSASCGKTSPRRPGRCRPRRAPAAPTRAAAWGWPASWRPRRRSRSWPGAGRRTGRRAAPRGSPARAAGPRRPSRAAGSRAGRAARARRPAAEDDPEDHPDHHDRDAEPQVEPERAGPTGWSERRAVHHDGRHGHQRAAAAAGWW